MNFLSRGSNEFAEPVGIWLAAWTSQLNGEPAEVILGILHIFRCRIDYLVGKSCAIRATCCLTTQEETVHVTGAIMRRAAETRLIEHNVGRVNTK